MPRTLTIYGDTKIAVVLAAAFALLAAAAVPFILQVVPPEARTLPLPVPLFSLILALQSLIVYGLFALAGLRMARRRALDPAPFLSGLWMRKLPDRIWIPLGISCGTGIFCGLLLFIIVSAIQRLAPHTLPQLLHPLSFEAALLASAAASVGEEILCRLFALSALLRILPVSPLSTFWAILGSALIFGALHAPAAVFLFGGLQSVPPVSWVWVIGLNGLVGIAFGALFIRYGIEGAILGHFGTDFVWHVIPRMLS